MADQPRDLPVRPDPPAQRTLSGALLRAGARAAAAALLLVFGCLLATAPEKNRQSLNHDGGSPVSTFKGPTRQATFAAGCFWGVEARFRSIDGVVDAAVGYCGGTRENPTYQDVCTGRTGHAEAVQVEYDPARVSYEQLLDVFWNNHNPTTRNRQGPDVGSQYRSVIFFHDAEQEAAARTSKERLNASGRFQSEIVTEIVPADTFWRAEEYHQNYLAKHGRSSCSI